MDVHEVCNYLDAIKYAASHGLRARRELLLSLRLLNEAHRPSHARSPLVPTSSRAKFAASQNWIGGTRPGNAVFRFLPPPEELTALLAGPRKVSSHQE